MRINFSLAALALLLSITLWVLVVNDQNPERVDVPDVAIPVEVDLVPSGLMVMNTVDPVRFKVRAPKDRWASLRSSSFRASVDLSRVGPGIQAVPVVPEASDPQVRVLEVIPNTVSVRLEELKERTVPIKANLIGNVPFGYVYGAAKTDPEVAVVSGPASLVQSVEAASVDIRLDGITVDIDSAFHPVPLDSNGVTVRTVRLAPQTVRIQVPVQQQISYKPVGVRAPIAGAAAPGYWVGSVSVDPPAVTVVGDPKVLAGINYLDTATINLNGATSSMDQELRITLPQGVSLLQPQQTARVKVTISTLQASQVVRVAPRVVNPDPTLRVAGVPSYLELTLQGPAPIMQGLSVDAIGATLDLTGLGEGTHEVKPGIIVPPSVSVSAAVPASVTVVLSAAPTVTPTPVPTAGSTPAAQSTSPVPDGTATPAPPTR